MEGTSGLGWHSAAAGTAKGRYYAVIIDGNDVDELGN
jgi:hypothetical protein